MTVYGLVDCNNFFVSCERVFRPALEGRPTVVLPSNDGCIVARSDEAKSLGIKMAQPAFQAKELIERHGIAVISGNLQFYTDMSNRVVQTLAELTPAVEKYSIDECFLDLTGIPEDLTLFCRTVRRTVRQWTGLPVGISIAETKTLAKIANRIAKTSAKTNGVLNLTGSPWRDKALAATEVGDVWGIGRQYTRKLNRNGVKTALDLSRRPDGWVRREMGVGGLRTVRELRGEDCIGFDDMPQPKQTTMVSRSFDDEVRELDDLANAITVFATDAAQSIRKAGLAASSVSVFIETNRFAKGEGPRVESKSGWDVNGVEIWLILGIFLAEQIPDTRILKRAQEARGVGRNAAPAPSCLTRRPGRRRSSFRLPLGPSFAACRERGFTYSRTVGAKVR